ncbi:hypothetical protein CROQUDRAFT_655247 [Cronartium quercuum f. sp. fusiforme G11]|uniref:Uncharacterized protein n=1 Tax=Cronartium quercuum f. sp. fusiforme G11 TaxID=708437 RepID=A0A9P6NJE6_9BASI|nr:hypothetical protein CROQUDRAFT_655247 [Cronartium quercuum f. sp. fusiforme G11]
MPPKKNQKKSSQGSKNASKAVSKAATPQPPGTPLEALPLQKPSTIVVGINFGQTASSIALISKDGSADCIANDDGDRQIPSVVSFSGSQVYIGNPARLQLVRNQSNTIVGFRNLLGKTYEDVKTVKPLYNSAPIINKDGEPAYSIKIQMDENSSETVDEQIKTVTEINTKYLETLLQYAQDFIGRKPDAAVFSIPGNFDAKQIEALRSISEDKLGVKVLQFIDEATATAVAYDLANLKSGKRDPHSNVIVLNVGGSSTTVSVLCRRYGLYVPLASSTDPRIGGNQFDDQLMEYFIKEFNKKYKTNLNMSSDQNHRSLVKLRLATEVTKKTLSASNSANCSVDSLFEGYDFSGSINRMRCDLLLNKLYAGIIKLVIETISKSGLEKEDIHELILIGGSTKLPAIGEKVSLAINSSIKVQSALEPDEAVALGCTLQGTLAVKNYPLKSETSKDEFGSTLTAECTGVECLSKPIGLLLPASDLSSPHAVNGKQFVTLLEALTPLPIKQSFQLPFSKTGQSGRIPIDIWQGVPALKVDELKPNGNANNDGSDEDEDEEPERTRIVQPECAIAHLDLQNVQLGDKITITLTIEKGQGKVQVATGTKGTENSVQTEFKVGS